MTVERRRKLIEVALPLEAINRESAREKSNGDRLAERVTEKLKRTGQLTGELAASSIRLDLDTNLGTVWGRGHASVGTCDPATAATRT